jgi:dihydroflavonol-4-reductase
MKILITGASGFIGSFLVEEALNQGMEVWAGMRQSSSRKYLTDARIRFAELDFARPDKLRAQLQKHQTEHQGWDIIVHAAGATKCLKKEDFERTNFTGTQNLVNELTELHMIPSQFIYLSSLSVFGAIRDQKASGNEPWCYLPILENDTPKPNTAYGASKFKSESFLMSHSDFPWLIFRPTGVYGPREKDYFLMAQSIKSHIDFAVGYKPQEITFVYVKDVAQAIFKAIALNVTHRAYFLSDGAVYHSRAFSDLLQKELGNPWVLHIKAPIWVLCAVCAIGGVISRMRHKVGTLNMDKYHILRQRNWQCDITPAEKELGYKPEYPLERGVHEAVVWYKEQGWL